MELPSFLPRLINCACKYLLFLRLYILFRLCYTGPVNNIHLLRGPSGVFCTARAEQDNGVQIPNGTAAVSDYTLSW